MNFWKKALCSSPAQSSAFYCTVHLQLDSDRYTYVVDHTILQSTLPCPGKSLKREKTEREENQSRCYGMGFEAQLIVLTYLRTPGTCYSLDVYSWESHGYVSLSRCAYVCVCVWYFMHCSSFWYPMWMELLEHVIKELGNNARREPIPQPYLLSLLQLWRL